MHITLIQPAVGRKPGRSPYPASWRMEPLGIATLASLTPARIGRTFFDDRLEPIDYDRPTDLACITVETYTARRAYQIASEFRKRGVRILLGGFHPTLLPDEAAAHADAVVIGEAEPVWAEVLDDAAAGTLKPRYTAARPALDKIDPDRSIFGSRKYGLASLVETSRGCRFNCEFCSISPFFRHECRERPVGEVVHEVRTLKKPVFFVDDNLGVNPDRLRALCEALIPLKRPWVGQASLNIANDPALLALMARSGCQGVLIGFESLDAATLSAMGKAVNLAARDYPRAIRAFRNHGLSIYATFVFGYDHDTPDTFRRVYDFALEQKFFFAAFNHLVPFPGTPLYRRLAAQNRLLSPHWWLEPGGQFGDVVFQPAHMTPSQLAGLCESHRRRFYSLSSVARRGLDFKANVRTPLKALIFLGQNLLHRREVVRRQGLPFGVPEGLA
jgi:radical SAM superfamily enzyme YgiQ (UPF0313 family)